MVPFFPAADNRNIEFPSANPPFPGGAPSADVHLRTVFYRLGLNNRETVALCGAHTIGTGTGAIAYVDT